MSYKYCFDVYFICKLFNINVLMPAVANAEKTSKTKSMKSIFSLIASTNKPNIEIKKLTRPIVNERFTTWSDIVLFMILIVSLPWTNERIYNNIIAVVTVLIPPAVPAGDPPINI